MSHEVSQFNSEQNSIALNNASITGGGKMSAEHTPGPWKINNNVGRKGELGIIADAAPCIIAIMGNAKEWPVEAQANARLIAAAPALLEACKKGLKYIQDQHRNDKNWGCCGNATGDYDCEVCKDIAEIEAAIK